MSALPCRRSIILFFRLLCGGGCDTKPPPARGHGDQQAERIRSAVAAVAAQFGGVVDSSGGPVDPLAIPFTLERQRILVRPDQRPVVSEAALADVWEEDGAFWAQFNSETNELTAAVLRVSQETADSLIAAHPEPYGDNFVFAARIESVRKTTVGMTASDGDRPRLAFEPAAMLVIRGTLVGYRLVRYERAARQRTNSDR